MSDLPLPLPDRRLLLDLQTQNYKSTYINNYQNQNNEQSETINKNTIINYSLKKHYIFPNLHLQK